MQMVLEALACSATFDELQDYVEALLGENPNRLRSNIPPNEVNNRAGKLKCILCLQVKTISAENCLEIDQIYR